ncbi:MAG: YnbE family lipoprotein [Alphaproteobacteria bacterium]
MRRTVGAGALVLGLLLVGCAPTVKVQGGDKPIVIDLNVKIQQEVRVRVDKDIDNLVKSDPSLF